jgi:kanamycin nucleotidyltransferase
MPGGPQPVEREQRLKLAREIADRAIAVRGQHILAIGLYGSIARGTDGPYSDIEILCVLDTLDEDYDYEWVHGPWKAEINFLSKNVLLAKTANVDERWPLTHGAFCNILAFHDPHNFFATLRDVVLSQPQEHFAAAIRSCIVFNLYEMMGKLRNARYSYNTAYFPTLALHATTIGAYIIGLANRYHYTSASHLLTESLTFPNRPSGYDELCHLVMSGDLRDPQLIYILCETFWSGVEQWAADKGISFEERRKIPF